MSLVESQGGYQDDPEFEALADALSSEVFDITASNGRLWTLLNAGKLEAAFNATADNRTKIRGCRQSLERLSRWSEPGPAQRFTQHKITREFGTAFSEFQKIQKSLAKKEREALNSRQSVDENAASSPNGSSQPSSLIELENDPQLLQRQAFEDQLQEDEVAYQQGLIQDREEEIQGIEQGINELNDIFTSLSSVIQEQGHTLDNIESNIYNVRDDTHHGSRELTKALRWQRSATGRKLCILMILLVIALVIILSISI